MTETDILRGWKEIEAYLRMRRGAILRAQYPIRFEKTRRNVFAIRDELMEHARQQKQIPTIPPC